MPSAGDIGWFLFAIFAAAGVYRLAHPTGKARWIAHLDALATVVATSAMLVAGLHGKLIHSEGSTAMKATALAYPLLYCAFAALLLESIGRSPQLLRVPALSLILAGAALEAIGFTSWSGQLFDGSYMAGTNSADMLWTLGCLAIGGGGFLAASRNLSLRPDEQVLRHRSPVPALAFGALVAMLMLAAIRHWPLPGRLTLDAAVFVVGGALVARAWKMSRLWSETLGRERSARTALERTNRELEAFSYAASHDLKAPLVSVQGFAASLRRRSGERLDEHGTLYLDRIESNAVALQVLVDELLDFARVGGDSGDLEGIDADAIAQDVVRSFRERHGGSGANVELLGRLPSVQAHPTRFRQALTNLVENAITHSGRPAPRVQIGSHVTNGHVAIVVEDDGPGIDEADRERLFDLFTRGARSGFAAPGSSGGGAGVGLALVKKIAETSGGSVSYEPGTQGGSRFVLSLPRGAAG